MTSLVSQSRERAQPQPRLRRFLMCPPQHFGVTYAINPWMDVSRPVSRQLAIRQWDSLVAAYTDHGHRVDLLTPRPGLSDMVFAANGATVVSGRVLLANFAAVQRRPESVDHAQWHRDNGNAENGYGMVEMRSGVAANEAEGDFAVLDGMILAGYGFRTERGAHHELARLTGVEVLSLRLIDPRFYHLDTALTVLDDGAGLIAYYPSAFSAESRQILSERFPDAVIASESDATVLGLNAVSDSCHVFLPAGADQFAQQLQGIGYRVIEIDLSELIKAGGSVKCCTQEIRGLPLPG